MTSPDGLEEKLLSEKKLDFVAAWADNLVAAARAADKLVNKGSGVVKALVARVTTN